MKTPLRAVDSNTQHARDLARSAVKAHRTRHIARLPDETLGVALSPEDERRRTLDFMNRSVRFHRASLWRRLLRLVK